MNYINLKEGCFFGYCAEFATVWESHILVPLRLNNAKVADASMRKIGSGLTHFTEEISERVVTLVV